MSKIGPRTAEIYVPPIIRDAAFRTLTRRDIQLISWLIHCGCFAPSSSSAFERLPIHASMFPVPSPCDWNDRERGEKGGRGIQIHPMFPCRVFLSMWPRCARNVSEVFFSQWELTRHPRTNKKQVAATSVIAVIFDWEPLIDKEAQQNATTYR